MNAHNLSYLGKREMQCIHLLRQMTAVSRQLRMLSSVPNHSAARLQRVLKKQGDKFNVTPV